MMERIAIVRRNLRDLLDRILFHQGPRLGKLAHHAENPFHVAYLSGVVFGGGYRYAAIGMLICIAVAWLFTEH